MNSLAPEPPVVNALSSEPTSLSDELAQLRLQGRQLSRAIGMAKKSGADTTALLEQRRRLSQREQEVSLQLAATESSPTSTPLTDKGTSLHESRAASVRPDAGPVEVSLLDEAQSASWDAYVAQHPAASSYHLHAWRLICQQAFGCESHYLVARRAQRIVGVLPLVQLNSPLFGNFLVSMPFLNYGGVLAEDSTAHQALVEQSAILMRTLGCSHVELREMVPSTTWPMRTDKVSMWLPLPPTEEALWSGLGSKLRAQIKRGQSHGLVFQIGGLELLDDFYRVFSTNMRDLGTPVYAKQFFKKVLSLAPGTPELVVGRDTRGRAVAASLVLRHGRRMEVPWASTLRRANGLNANMVLYWTMLGHACRSGCTTFDFGRSTADANTYRFKKQWGAQPVPLYWHYAMSQGEAVPQLNPSNPKYRLAIAVWKRLPLAVANLLGPHLSRSLP